MSIIEQAARRLDELKRAGVEVPWAAAGLSEVEATALAGPLRDATASTHAAGPAHTGHTAANAPLAPTPQPTGRATPLRSVEIDIERLLAEGQLVPGQRRSALMDEFRGIKRPLLKGARGAESARLDRGNLIMLTSALPGEGKTFCAINLALSMAMEIDTSVLLVDADVVRPSLLPRLGVAGRFEGLLDLLSEPTTPLDQVLLQTNVDKLLLLPPGGQRFDSTELLASAAMENLLDLLAREHPDQIVIFDAPPLLVTTESKVLASRVGQVVVVVDQERTSPHDVAKAFSILGDLPVVCSLLNKSRSASETDRYGYYEA
jgi:protein-tyrosine kinase